MKDLLIEQSEKFKQEIKRARAYEAAKKIAFLLDKRLEIEAIIQDSKEQIAQHPDAQSTIIGHKRNIEGREAELTEIRSELAKELKSAMYFDKVLEDEFQEFVRTIE